MKDYSKYVIYTYSYVSNNQHQASLNIILNGC